MAAQNRPSDHSVIEDLVRFGPRYSFYQAVHLLQSLFPDSARVGCQGPPEEEAVRFRVDASLAFPGADIQQVRPVEREGRNTRYEVTVSFLGLVGAASPLPTSYAEEALHQDPAEGLTRGFLDLFHHRAVSLLYRVWEKYQYPRQFEADGSDPVSRRLLTLNGLRAPGAWTREDVPAIRLLAWTGLLAMVPRTASALRALIHDFFDGLPVRVEQCVKRFMEIRPEQRSSLGLVNSRPGVDLSLGDRVPDRGATFRVVLGPVPLEQYMSFVPAGENAGRLRALIDLFNSDGLDYQIEAGVVNAEIPELRLGGPKSRLGWSTWLGSRPAGDPFVLFLSYGRPHGDR